MCEVLFKIFCVLIFYLLLLFIAFLYFLTATVTAFRALTLFIWASGRAFGLWRSRRSNPRGYHSNTCVWPDL